MNTAAPVDGGPTAPRCTLFGLGEMGMGIGLRIAAGGMALAAHDICAGRRQRWAAQCRHGASHAPEDSTVVLLALGDMNATARLLDSLLPRLAPGTLVVDHGTAAPDFLVRWQAQWPELAFCDAPLSGGRAGAQAGTLAAFIGGTDGDVGRIRPVLGTYCSHMTHFGPLGTGSVAKAANQVAIAGIVRGLVEAVAIGRTVGLDPVLLLEALSNGNAGSRQIADAMKRLGQDEATETLFRTGYDWLAQDLAIGAALAPDLPLARLVSRLLARP